MLLRNGYEAGARALTADAADLTAVTIQSHDGAGSTVRSASAFIRGVRGLVPEASGPTQDDLNAAGGNSRDWLYHTHDYSGRRYSDLADINTDNVGQLAPVCMYAMGDAGAFQSGPIVRDGVMYVTTLRSTGQPPISGLLPPNDVLPEVVAAVPPSRPGAMTSLLSGPSESQSGGTSRSTIRDVSARPPSSAYSSGASS